MESCADIICNCGEHECSNKLRRDLIKPVVFEDIIPESEAKEKYSGDAIYQDIASPESRKSGYRYTPEKNTESKETQIPQGTFEMRVNDLNSFVARPPPSKVDPDHVCSPCESLISEACARCQMKECKIRPCVECSNLFDELAVVGKAIPEGTGQRRRVHFDSGDDAEDGPVDFRTCTEHDRQQIPAVGEVSYGDVPYLIPYGDPQCIKRILHQGHPDNLYTSGPFEGRSETAERFLNPGLPAKQPYVLRKRSLEPPPFFATSVYRRDYEPPLPRKPLDIHAARMTREPTVEWERTPPAKNPHKEEYQLPTKKEPDVICVEEPQPRRLESTYNHDYICYHRDLPRTSKIKDIQVRRQYAKEDILTSHLECPLGAANDYVCCLCLCCPPCQCPAKGTPVTELEGAPQGRPRYLREQEVNVDPYRISAFCKGHDYHPAPPQMVQKS